MNLNLIGRMRASREAAPAIVAKAEEVDDEEAKSKAAEDEKDPEAKKGAAAEGDEKETDAKASGKAKGNAEDDDGEDKEDMKADASMIAKMCAEAGHVGLVKPLIGANLTVAQVRQRIEDAGEITKIFAHAAKANPQIDAGLGAKLVADGVSVATAREIANTLLVSGQSPEIRNSHQGGTAPTDVDMAIKRSIEAVNSRIN